MDKQNSTLLKKCFLTSYVIHLISPRSTFSILPTSRRSAIFVESFSSQETRCTPPTILNCKHLKSSLFSRVIAFLDGVLPCLVVTIKDGFFILECWYGAATTILITPDCFKLRTYKINYSRIRHDSQSLERAYLSQVASYHQESINCYQFIFSCFTLNSSGD